MADLVETVVEDDRWDGLGLSQLAEQAARATLASRGMPAEGVVIALLGTDDARMAELNEAFRGKARPTNVLSWPAEVRRSVPAGEAAAVPAPWHDDAEPLGDIALAWETCAAEAKAAGLSMADHVRHLVVHGVLHLLGFDHVQQDDAARMEACETEILASLGIADPY